MTAGIRGRLQVSGPLLSTVIDIAGVGGGGGGDNSGIMRGLSALIKDGSLSAL